MWEGTEMDLKE